MIILFAVLLFAAPPPTGLAPTGFKEPGVLWYGYSVRTGASDVRVDDVAQVAPPNGRTSRYTSAIAHGGALSRVEVALGTPQSSVVYYEDGSQTRTPGAYPARYQKVSPQSLPGLVTFVPGYEQPYGADGPPVPTLRFVGQVDHSQQPRPIVSPISTGPVGAPLLPPVLGVQTTLRGGGQSGVPPPTILVQRQPVLGAPSVQPVHVSPLLPTQPDVAKRKAAVISLVVQPQSPRELGAAVASNEEIKSARVLTTLTPNAQEQVLALPNAAVDVTAPAVQAVSKSPDGDELQLSDTLPGSDVQSTIPAGPGVKQIKVIDTGVGALVTTSTVASIPLQTSQSQDTTAVVKNHVQTPLVLNDGRGQYDFRGYKQFAGPSGAAFVGEAPEDSRTSKKLRHNFRVS